MRVIRGDNDDRREATVALEGDLTIKEAPEVYEVFRSLWRDPALDTVRIDFSRVGEIDSAGVALISLASRRFKESGKRCLRVHVTEAHQRAFELLPERVSEPKPRAPRSFEQRLGVWLGAFTTALMELSEMVVDTAHSAIKALFGKRQARRGSVSQQAVVIGVDALLIVAPLSLLIGLILAFQAVRQLQPFGAELFMADVVGLGMVREFGAMMTGIILAGRSGAAMAAELGTMTIREETDALRTMGIAPVRILVLPRLAAITLVQPALTLMSMAIGIAGSLSIASNLGLSGALVFNRMLETLTLSDFWLGLSKSVLFAWVIGFTACFVGLRTQGGGQSVGRSTPRAVVASIFLIIVVDSAVTTLWTLGYD